MTDAITTERLLLRRFRDDDEAVVATALQDIDIARMIPAMPWPYGAEEARVFITRTAPNDPSIYAVEHEGKLVGTIGVGEQLGYWFMLSAWGQGFATEASRSVLATRFRSDQSPLRSGHRIGNDRSRRVLQKLGFRDTGQRQAFCNAEGADVAMQDMELTFADWEARQ